MIEDRRSFRYRTVVQSIEALKKTTTPRWYQLWASPRAHYAEHAGAEVMVKGLIDTLRINASIVVASKHYGCERVIGD